MVDARSCVSQTESTARVQSITSPVSQASTPAETHRDNKEAEKEREAARGSE